MSIITDIKCFLLTFTLMMCFLCFALEAKSESYKSVKVSTLLEQPKKFDKKNISVDGCLLVEFENDLIFESDDACKFDEEKTKTIGVLLGLTSELRDVDPMKRKIYRVSLKGKLRYRPFEIKKQYIENVRILKVSDLKSN